MGQRTRQTTRPRPRDQEREATTARESPALARYWAWLAYGSMALMVLVLTLPFKVGVGDTWGAIVQGQYILEHGLPNTDPFSYTAPAIGRPLVIHEWLGDVLFALIYQTAGIPGLLGLKVVLVALTFFLMLQTAQTLGASTTVLPLGCGVLGWIVWPYITERVLLFSSLGLVLYFWLYVHVRQGKVRPAWLWLLVPTHAVWANLHGGHIQGLVLLGIVALGEAATWVRARYGGPRVAQALPGHLVVQCLLLPVLALAAACVTPYGWGLLVQPFREAAIQRGMVVNGEWQPVYLHLYRSGGMWAYLAALLVLWLTWITAHPVRPPAGTAWLRIVTGVLGVGILGIALGHHPAPYLDEGPIQFLGRLDGVEYALRGLLVALLVVWAIHAVWAWQRVDVVQACLVGVFVGLSFRYIRVVPDAARLLFPVAMASLSTVWPRCLAGAASRKRAVVAQIQARWVLCVGVGVQLALGWYLLITFVPRPGAYIDARTVGWGASTPTYMECVARFFETHGVTGHVWGDGPHASWLLFRLWPRITVENDGRMYAYGAELLRAGDVALREPEAMQAYLQRFPTDVLAMPHAHLSREVYALLATLEWRYVYMDNTMFVAIPHNGRMASLLRQDTIAHIHPGANLPVDAHNAQAVLAEADRLLAECPTDATFAWSYKARALQSLGRTADAAEAGRHIPAFLSVTWPRVYRSPLLAAR